MGRIVKLYNPDFKADGKLHGDAEYVFYALYGILAFATGILALGCHKFGAFLSLLAYAPLAIFKDCPCYHSEDKEELQMIFMLKHVAAIGGFLLLMGVPSPAKKVKQD